MPSNHFFEHRLESAGTAEIFLTAATVLPQVTPAHVRDIYTQAGEILAKAGGRIFHERVFGPPGSADMLAKARREALAGVAASKGAPGLDDGVPPTMLVAPRGLSSMGGLPETFALQVHAVAGATPQVIGAPNRKSPGSRVESPGSATASCPAGRVVQQGDVRHIVIGPLTAPAIGRHSGDSDSRRAASGSGHVVLGCPSDAPQAARQAAREADAVFHAAARLLAEAGADMRAVARTWLWLGDILSWYDQLNQVRNQFFTRCGLLDPSTGRIRMPASTGIGVYPADGGQCGLELRAVFGTETLGRRDAETPGHENAGSRPSASGLPFREETATAQADLIQLHAAAGRQDSPYRYGSAFSRAATAASPAGRTLFISGTAAIDPAGASMHLGDAARQIEVTVANVRAILAQHGCTDGDVVQCLAYCKTPAVETTWRRDFADVPWPTVTLIADVCRVELLFEMELTACPGARLIGRP